MKLKSTAAGRVQTGVTTISVVIPTYNCLKYLPAAIESVLRQTVPVLEIIVVDDGSTDGTAEWLRQTTHPRIRTILQDNAGVSAARNKGIQSAAGEWISFLDADDFWREDRVERLLPNLTDRVDFVYNSIRVVAENGIPLSRRKHISSKRIKTSLLTNNFLIPSAVVVRRAVIDEVGGFTLGIEGLEDWDLWVRIARRHKMRDIPEDLTFYRQVPNSLSRSYDLLRKAPLLADRIASQIIWPLRNICRRKIIASHSLSFSSVARQNGNHAHARELIIDSIKAWPSPLWELQRFRTLFSSEL